MKKMPVLLFFLCSHFIVHAMEQGNQVVSPDWMGKHNLLVEDYKDVLRYTLEVYKKADINTWNMKKLDTIGNVITKHHWHQTSSIISNIVDADGNTFLIWAVKKDDKKSFDWLIFFNGNKNFQVNYNKNFYVKNRHGQTVFDVCIKKLSPAISADKKVVSRKIFDSLASHLSLWSTDEERIECLKKIIDLQLSYVPYGVEFSVPLQKLKGFICPLQWEISQEKKIAINVELAEHYRTAKNKQGYTFAHQFSDNPDKLFELAQKSYVSFAKNKSGETAIDLAIKRLRYYILNPDQIIENLGELQRRSCCVYILLNHALLRLSFEKTSEDKQGFKGQAKNDSDIADMSDFGPCCAKHTVKL